jgi:hypothetical protein
MSESGFVVTEDTGDTDAAGTLHVVGAARELLGGAAAKRRAENDRSSKIRRVRVLRFRRSRGQQVVARSVRPSGRRRRAVLAVTLLVVLIGGVVFVARRRRLKTSETPPQTVLAPEDQVSTMVGEPAGLN